MLVKVSGAAIHGVSAQIITIEVNVDQGVGYHLVGLPDNAIKESSYRISAALKNSGFKIPGKKITINIIAIHFIYRPIHFLKDTQINEYNIINICQ